MMPTDSLTTLLRRWNHDPAIAPGFSAGVWARIDAARRDQRVVVAFRWALPLAASVALLLGMGAARAEVKRDHAEVMAAYYVRTIDPVQITSHAGHHP